MATIQTNNTALETTSVKDFMLGNGFTQVCKQVRVNTNGYPFVTFMDATNTAHNIYFSKKAASSFEEGAAIEKGFFDNLLIAFTTNAEGEGRIRLCMKGEGNSQRLDLADLF